MRILALVCLLAACRTQPEELPPGDLGTPDLAVADLTIVGPGQALVMTCCGGAPPECTPAPDGGCVLPMETCEYPLTCYLPCTAPPNYPVSVPSACQNISTNLCQCITDHGGQDPCFPNGGSSCDATTPNLPAGEIVCQCY